MATEFTKDGWSKDEQPVFLINRSFQPPFYVETVGGNDDEQSFSAGDRYLILRKLKVESVKASTSQESYPNASMKIPLDYTGKFCPASSKSQDAEGLHSLREFVSSSKFPQQVRLGNPQQHSKLFLERLYGDDGKHVFVDKLHGSLDYIITLSECVTDEYYIGRSLDGTLLITFSTESNLRFLVKKVTGATEVEHLQLKVDDLSQDVFLSRKGGEPIQFFELKDVLIPPKPPPKPSPKGSKGQIRVLGSAECDEQVDHYNDKNLYEDMASLGPVVRPKPSVPLRGHMKQSETSLSPPVSPRPRPRSAPNWRPPSVDDDIQQPSTAVVSPYNASLDGTPQRRKSDKKRPTSLHDEVVTRTNFNKQSQGTLKHIIGKY